DPVELARDLREDAAVQPAAVWHRVRLVGERDALAAARTRVLARRPADALHALARVDVLLDRDLVGRALLEIAAHADVHALRILAEDDEIDVLVAHVAQWREARIVETDGAQIDVEVEPETEAEQDGARVRMV